MASATLNLKISPRRMVSEKEAAEYCGLPVKQFRVVCQVRAISYPHGKLVYDLRDLDNWLDVFKANGVSGTDEADDILGRLS